MRIHLLGLILMASAAAPALAQPRPDSIDRRLERIEQQLRAVQRRVFPDGNAQFVEPEIGDRPAAGPGGSASGDALTGLTARVDALEAQLRTLTGQVEENGFRTRQVEQQLTQLRADLTARLDRIDASARPPEPRAEPRREPRTEPAASEPEPRAAPTTAGTDTAEEAYNVGFRHWDAGRYAEAQAALDAAATRHPNSRWTSWMRNLQGRAYLDDSKPATAARILLANYQDNPQGERAADSLLYLGQALTRLNRRTEACRVLDELARVYPNMRGQIRNMLPRARTDARCEGN